MKVGNREESLDLLGIPSLHGGGQKEPKCVELIDGILGEIGEKNHWTSCHQNKMVLLQARQP